MKSLKEESTRRTISHLNKALMADEEEKLNLISVSGRLS